MKGKAPKPSAGSRKRGQQDHEILGKINPPHPWGRGGDILVKVAPSTYPTKEDD